MGIQKFDKLLSPVVPKYTMAVISQVPASHFAHVLIIVSNTFINALELSRYQELNYKLTIKF